MLLNIFIDTVIRSVEPLLKNLGIKVSYRLDGNLRECSNPTESTLTWLMMYADDIALITETRVQMQQALNILDQAFTDWGLQNLDKTEIMRVGSLDEVDPEPCIVRDQAIKEVKHFKYLGSICSADLSLTPEITSRVCKAGHAFFKLKELRLWNDPRLSKRTKLTIYKVIVQSALLYACETWAVTAKDVQRLQVFLLKCLRCIQGIG